MTELTDEALLELADEYDWQSDLSVWLPRPGLNETRCGDSCLERGEQRACHLVKDHLGDHCDVKNNVSWPLNWRPKGSPPTKETEG